MVPRIIQTIITIAALLALAADGFPQNRETVGFASLDSLEITADVSAPHDLTAPFIVLFHQAGWSRGEYKEIVPQLNRLGFNCMAVDQRSGGEVNGVKNRTTERAAKAGKATAYLDAYPDLQAAVNFATAKFVRGKLIVWGSSYSAALVIKLAADNPETIDGVLAFSPGEYFGKGLSVTAAARKVKCPVFVTSARSERDNWAGFFSVISAEGKQFFIPETAGNHGSRALWSQFKDSGSCWQAVTAFLEMNFLREAKEKE